MSALIRLVFFSIFASLVVALYGEDIIRSAHDEAAGAGKSASNQIFSENKIVNSVQIPLQPDGHYWINVGVNHADISFVVDTGASIVTLSYQDAMKLNIPYFENDFNVTVNTAAGQTKMAAVALDSVCIGSIELYDVNALVAQEGLLSVSLLGMNFLNRLDRFEFRDQRLILEQ